MDEQLADNQISSSLITPTANIILSTMDGIHVYMVAG